MDRYICSYCRMAGSKRFISYKVIRDEGDSIKFMQQLCEKCYSKIFDKEVDLAPNTEKELDDMDT